jgi:hypothetical protein
MLSDVSSINNAKAILYQHSFVKHLHILTPCTYSLLRLICGLRGFLRAGILRWKDFNVLLLLKYLVSLLQFNLNEGYYRPCACSLFELKQYLEQ